MGGHLLHLWNLPEKRLSRADFDAVAGSVVASLRAILGNSHRIELLRFFDEKESFGDMDVAVESKSGSNLNWHRLLEDAFGYKPHKNGNCYSFPVRGFQVDVLMFGSEVFDIAQVYYAYESGNFMGRMADPKGFSHGHRGLYLQVPLSYFGHGPPEQEYREILISRDPEVIFQLLGFDYERFKRGFRNFEAMSEWAAASKYFSPEVFAFESLNSINRTRNRKRPVYAAFVEWCKAQPASKHRMPSKADLRARMVREYEHVAAAIVSIREEVLKNAERRSKFNGHLIKEMLNIEGAALGDFIIAFRKQFEDFNEYLDKSDAGQVKKHIQAFWADRLSVQS